MPKKHKEESQIKRKEESRVELLWSFLVSAPNKLDLEGIREVRRAAILLSQSGWDYDEARKRLSEAGGNLEKAVPDLDPPNLDL